MEEKNEESPLGFEIRTLSNQINRRINQMISEEEENLTAHQCWVLKFLIQNQEREIFQKDIESFFSIRRSTANHMLQLMEKNGYLNRVSVPEDGRMKRLVCTEKGWQAYRRMEERLSRFACMLKAGISQEEIQEFRRMLQRMNDNIL